VVERERGRERKRGGPLEVTEDEISNNCFGWRMVDCKGIWGGGGVKAEGIYFLAISLVKNLNISTVFP